MNDLFEYDCTCPNCGYMKNLVGEEADCSLIKCPKCGFAAMSDIKSTEENVSADFNMEQVVLENLHPKPIHTSGRYICESCKTIIHQQMYSKQKGQCPHCSEYTTPMFEDIDISEKRSECLNCKTSYLYNSRLGQYCEACNGMLYTYAPTKKIPKGNPLPIE